MSRPINLHTQELDEITFSDVEKFCAQKVQENSQLDYKEILPSKGLAKHIAALSNTKGGLIIIGVAEDSQTGEPKKWEGIAKDGKLIDQVYQNAANVVPYPTIKVCFTDERKRKAFLLLQIIEGGSPPYHTVSDPTIWIRTGNVSTPLDKIRQDDLDRLYRKKERAEAVRIANRTKAEEIFNASLVRADEERKKEIVANPGTKVYDKPFLPHATVLSISIQPFFPEKAIAERQQLLARITEYQVRNGYGDFPNLGSEQCPGGISHFGWSKHSGDFASQVVLCNGMIFSTDDIQRPYKNSPAMSMNEICSLLARQLKVAANEYKLFGYTGVLSGEIKLTNCMGVKIYDLVPDRYQSWFDDGQITKISDYSWPIENIGTQLLDGKDTFFKVWKKLLKDIFWDLGMPVPDDQKLMDFLDRNLKLF